MWSQEVLPRCYVLSACPSPAMPWNARAHGGRKKGNVLRLRREVWGSKECIQGMHSMADSGRVFTRRPCCRTEWRTW